jgi:hypothetical protein
MVRWERWENAVTSRARNREERATLIAQSGRCPEIALGGPPAPGWQLVDCRTWTNMVRATPEAAPPALDWPGPALR